MSKYEVIDKIGIEKVPGSSTQAKMFTLARDIPGLRVTEDYRALYRGVGKDAMTVACRALPKEDPTGNQLNVYDKEFVDTLVEYLSKK